MALLKLDAVVHWSIPVNNLEEAEDFYGEILGLEHVGRLATSRMSCFTLGGHNIILCERKNPLVRTIEEDGRLHHAFDVSPEMFNKACKVFRDLGIKIHETCMMDAKPHTGCSVGGTMVGRTANVQRRHFDERQNVYTTGLRCLCRIGCGQEEHLGDVY